MALSYAFEEYWKHHQAKCDRRKNSKSTQRPYKFRLLNHSDIDPHSHNQILGNKRADQKACQAISSSDVTIINYFNLHDAKFITKSISNSMWLREWKQGSSKLNEIKTTFHPMALSIGFLKKNGNINANRYALTSIWWRSKTHPSVYDAPVAVHHSQSNTSYPKVEIKHPVRSTSHRLHDYLYN